MFSLLSPFVGVYFLTLTRGLCGLLAFKSKFQFFFFFETTPCNYLIYSRYVYSKFSIYIYIYKKFSLGLRSFLHVWRAAVVVQTIRVKRNVSAIVMAGNFVNVSIVIILEIRLKRLPGPSPVPGGYEKTRY